MFEADGALILNLPDDVILRILYHVGAQGQLRGCDRRLRQYGLDQLLWRAWCQGVGLRQLVSGAADWRESYICAMACSHKRGSRSMRYAASETKNEGIELWITDHHHPPMSTSCECRKCGARFSLTVKPHYDPQANGLRMTQAEFCRERGGKPWTEIWYTVGQLYSLRGDEGLELEDAVTRVELEGNPRDLLAGLSIRAEP